VSLVETSALCREITGRYVEIGAVAETRAGDVRVYFSDCSALFEHSEWRPRCTPRDVLEDTFGWISEHEQLFRDTLT
jgi:CDP-paratose 2-epimerase